VTSGNVPDEVKGGTGVLAKYGQTFDSAANGAVTNPGAKQD
jgi:dihydroxy-acid dehydratase